MIKVLIVDNFGWSQEVLLNILLANKHVQILERLVNEKTVLSKIKSDRPDIVLVNAYSAKRKVTQTIQLIMENHPIPVIVIDNGCDEKTLSDTLVAGALAIWQRPQGADDPLFQESALELERLIVSMSEIRVIKRKKQTVMRVAKPPVKAQKLRTQKDIALVVIGASTGGPGVLQALLTDIEPQQDVPMVIVQHMTTGFLKSFMLWLNSTTDHQYKIAEHNEILQGGYVYFAPDNHHIEVLKSGRVKLSKKTCEHGHCPSVAKLFLSVAGSYGKRVVAVLLTGMGKDGAEELAVIKNAGGITIAQDEESSVVFGMPGEAVRLDAAQYVFKPHEIADYINSVFASLKYTSNKE